MSLISDAVGLQSDSCWASLLVAESSNWNWNVNISRGAGRLQVIRRPSEARLAEASAVDRGMNDDRRVNAKTINCLPRWPNAPLNFIYIFTQQVLSNINVALLPGPVRCPETHRLQSEFSSDVPVWESQKQRLKGSFTALSFCVIRSESRFQPDPDDLIRTECCVETKRSFWSDHTRAHQRARPIRLFFRKTKFRHIFVLAKINK